MKKRKLNVDNIIIALVFLISSILVFHDLYVIVLKPIITTMVYGWTWYGLLIFVIALIASIITGEYLLKEIKKDL